VNECILISVACSWQIINQCNHDYKKYVGVTQKSFIKLRNTGNHFTTSIFFYLITQRIWYFIIPIDLPRTRFYLNES